MEKQKEIEELLKSDGEPEGITVRSNDGKMFFLSKEEAERLAIPSTNLSTAYYFSSLSHPGHPPTKISHGFCGNLKHWLDTHNPRSKKWRALCLYYFEEC